MLIMLISIQLLMDNTHITNSTYYYYYHFHYCHYHYHHYHLSQ